MSYIDAHVHVFVRPSKKYPRETSELAPADREAPVEQLLEEMEKSGVSKAVLIQLGGYRENHRYLGDCLRKFPKRFAGVGLVDLSSPSPEDELTQLVRTIGVKGIRLSRLGKPGTSMKNSPAYKLWERCDELGIIVCAYPRSDQLELFKFFIQEFPNVNVVFDHLGICPSNFSVDQFGRPHIETELPPPTMKEILKLSEHENVYVKLSGDYAFSHVPYPYEDMRPIYRALYKAYGADRLMWATDFPWIVEEPGYQKLTKLIDLHLPGLSRGEREAIMRGTASLMWGL